MRNLIPILVLSAAANVLAQTSPVKTVAMVGDRARFTASYGQTSGVDVSTLDVHAQLVPHLFALGSFADVTHDPGVNRIYTLGAGLEGEFGSGIASCNFAFGRIENATASTHVTRNQFGIAYALRPIESVQVELGLTRFLNSSVGVGDVTAPTLAIRLALANGMGVEVKGSTDDFLTGLGTSSSWSVGVTYGF